MNFTFEILNAVYLPNSEAFPDLGHLDVDVTDADTGLTQLATRLADADDPERVSTAFTIGSLLGMFEEGIEEETGSPLDAASLTPADANVYRWLNQAQDYRRLGLGEADQSNPELEAFVFNDVAVS